MRKRKLPDAATRQSNIRDGGHGRKWHNLSRTFIVRIKAGCRGYMRRSLGMLR